MKETPVPLARGLLRTGGSGLLGRVDERDRPELEGRDQEGGRASISATYDTTRASWYEVMGIMVIGITNGADGGVDPFTGDVDQTDYLTHGRLPENIDIGVRQPQPGPQQPAARCASGRCSDQRGRSRTSSSGRAT